MEDLLDKRLLSLSSSQRSPPSLLVGEGFLIVSFGVREINDIFLKNFVNGDATVLGC